MARKCWEALLCWEGFVRGFYIPIWGDEITILNKGVGCSKKIRSIFLSQTTEDDYYLSDKCLLSNKRNICCQTVEGFNEGFRVDLTVTWACIFKMAIFLKLPNNSSCAVRFEISRNFNATQMDRFLNSFRRCSISGTKIDAC